MTTQGSGDTGEGAEGQTDGGAAGDTTAAELNALRESATTLSKQVNTLQSQIAERDKELAKWQKKGKERDKIVDDKAKEGDSTAWEQKLTDLRNEFADKEDGYKKQLDTLQAELRQDRVIARGVAKAAELFTSDGLPLIQLLIERHCDFKDGNIIVKDERGEMRYSSSSSREPMSLDEFLNELAKKHPSVAKPRGNSGGDTGGQKTSGGNSNRVYSPEEVLRAPVTEQQKMFRENPESARQFLRAVSGGNK